MKLKKFAKRLLYRFPHSLPVGDTAFKAFCADICAVYDLPDLPSYHHAVATMIMNQSPTCDRIPPVFFAKSIKKAMANEVAYARLVELREEEKAAKIAAEKAASESQGSAEEVVSEA